MNNGALRAVKKLYVRLCAARDRIQPPELCPEGVPKPNWPVIPSLYAVIFVLDANVDLIKKVYDVNVFGVLSTTKNFAFLLLKARNSR
jgi:hypothetical protein